MDYGNLALTSLLLLYQFTVDANQSLCVKVDADELGNRVLEKLEG